MTRMKLISVLGHLLILFVSHAAVYFYGGSRAKHQAERDFNGQVITAMQDAVANFEIQLQSASQMNLVLGELISERQQADAKTTQELRHVLQKTEAHRVECVFDDGVMRILTEARHRANQAAASGVGRAVPSDPAQR